MGTQHEIRLIYIHGATMYSLYSKYKKNTEKKLFFSLIF